MSGWDPTEDDDVERALFARRPREVPPPFADVMASALRARSGATRRDAALPALLAAVAVAACSAGLVASAPGREATRSLIVAENAAGGAGGAGGDRRSALASTSGMPESELDGAGACRIEPAGSPFDETCAPAPTAMAAVASYDPTCAAAPGSTETSVGMSRVAAGATCEPEATGSVAGP